MKWEGGGDSVTLWPSVGSITHWKRWLPGEAGVEGAAWMGISKYVLGACSEHNSRCFPTTWRPEKKKMNVIPCGIWGLLALGEFCSPDNLNRLNYGRDLGRTVTEVKECCWVSASSYFVGDADRVGCLFSWDLTESKHCRESKRNFLKNHTKLGTSLAVLWLGPHCYCSGHGSHPWSGS